MVWRWQNSEWKWMTVAPSWRWRSRLGGTNKIGTNGDRGVASIASKGIDGRKALVASRNVDGRRPKESGRRRILTNNRRHSMGLNKQVAHWY